MRKHLLVVLAAVGCGGSTRSSGPPKGYEAHLAEAAQHDQRAAEHAVRAEHAERGGDNFACGDPVIDVLNDQTSSGGETVTSWVPCWDVQEETIARHRAAVLREREEARKDRQAARQLLDLERAHCAGIPDREVGHSPFVHRSAIREVIPRRTGGRLEGVRIVFKPVPGLNAAWMRKAIACQQARFAVRGKPPTYHTEDPTLVDGARVSVIQNGRNVEVVIDTDTREASLIVMARADELVTSQTTQR